MANAYLYYWRNNKFYSIVTPKVEYSLTEQGERFIPVLEAMQVWGKDLLHKKIEMHERHED